MKRFIEGEDRGQGTLVTELLDDYVAEDNPVRVVDVFVDELYLALLGFTRVQPAKTGRPAYHPAVLLKLYFTATSTASNRAVGSSAKRSVMSS
jgi:transposase